MHVWLEYEWRFALRTHAFWCKSVFVCMCFYLTFLVLSFHFQLFTNLLLPLLHTAHIFSVFHYLIVSHYLSSQNPCFKSNKKSLMREKFTSHITSDIYIYIYIPSAVGQLWLLKVHKYFPFHFRVRTWRLRFRPRSKRPWRRFFQLYLIVLHVLLLCVMSLALPSWKKLLGFSRDEGVMNHSLYRENDNAGIIS